MPPGYAYASDPEKGDSLTGSGTRYLRKQPPSASDSGGLMKEVDKLREGAGEDDGEKKPAHTRDSNNLRLSLTSPPDNSNVILDDEIKKTKVSFIIYTTFPLDSYVPTQLGQLYVYLLTVSIITRWLLFIVPLLAILWIPGILSVTKFPNATVR